MGEADADAWLKYDSFSIDQSVGVVQKFAALRTTKTGRKENKMDTKLEYKSPELTEYGSLEELTQIEAGAALDGQDGSLLD